MTDIDQAAADARENGELAEPKENGVSVEDGAPLESLCCKGGEWENRKINILGVVKRFISQLSYGQDLTRYISVKMRMCKFIAF